MNRNLKSFVIGAFLTVFIVGVIFAVWKMSQPGPIAPNVPQIKPQASEPTTTAACSLAFTVIPPVVKTCNSVCTSSNDCPTGNTCSNGNCRNPSCTSATDCVCPPPPPSPTCNSTCQSSSECPNDLACSSGRCRNPACVDQSGCKCPPPLKVCNETCTVNAECSTGLICAGGNCRNPSCITQPSCTCPPPAPVVPVTPVTPVVYTHKVCQNNACVTVNGRANDTCTSDVSCQPKATPPPIPKSGVELPTILTILGGVAMLAIGLIAL